MQLFKRLLLSFFPDETIGNTINPASIFVSFISSKEFFSVVYRKIIENYKLNLFDISMDPFEFKIWFGNNPSVQVKDIDTYYSYCAAANINGYRCFNTTNTSVSIILCLSPLIQNIFNKYDNKYFTQFLYTIYLLWFLFSAKIKIFPYNKREENFNRLVELILHYYALMLSQTKLPINDNIIIDIKKQIIGHGEIIFTLYEHYNKCSQLLDCYQSNRTDFYKRFFYDEIKEWKRKTAVQDFINNHEKYTKNYTISITERSILPLIIPADIIIKFLIGNNDVHLISKHILANIYDKTKIEQFIQSFRKNNDQREDFIYYITDYTHLKKNFFSGIKKFMTTIVNQYDNDESQEEIDEFLSTIWNVDNIDISKIPEKLKRESRIMEKLVNFYVTYIGSLQIGRWENMYIRQYRRSMIDSILENKTLKTNKMYSLPHYGWLLYTYSKNAFYYKYASDNIRAGKEKFYLPFSSTLKKAQSNMYIIKLLQENFIAWAFQDINGKDIRLYINQKNIIKVFKETFGTMIKKYIQGDEKKVIEYVYSPLIKILKETPNLKDIIKKNITPKDVFHVKENLYTADFWIYNIALQYIHQKCELSDNYTDMNILGIIATLRDTLFGCILYLQFLEKNKISKDQIDIIIDLYITDILHLHEDYITPYKEIIKKLQTHYAELLEQRMILDDNTKFLRIALENWLHFTKDKTPTMIKNVIIGEDIMRLRWCLKNISYYNKRYVIPK